MSTSTLVSSLVTRAEELSSPYVSAVRERSALVDKAASSVADLAVKYEVGSYVKKADALADRAAAETLARIPEATKTRVSSVLARSLEENQRLVGAYATAKVDGLASSVITLVDRIIPADEETQFAQEAPRAQVRALPRVVYRRAGRVGTELAASAAERKQLVLELALVQKTKAAAYARKTQAHVLDLADELRDELEVRTLPLRDAAAVRRAELLLKYREALAVLAVKRGVATEAAWAKLRASGMEVYVLQGQRQLTVLKQSADATIAGWRIVAAERSAAARTLFVEQKGKIVAITTQGADQVMVRVVAVRSALTLQYEKTAVAASALSTDVKSKTAAARAQAKAKTAQLIADAKKKAAAQRERAEKLYEESKTTALEKSAMLRTSAGELAARAAKETPAVAGQLASRALGAERGLQVEKSVASMIAALPLVAVA